MSDLEQLSKDIFTNAVNKGFWDGAELMDSRGEEKFPFFAYKLMMIDSEVTEVMEAIRKEKGGLEVVKELADIQIRLLDLYYGLKVFGEISSDLSLEKVLADKVEYNAERPQKHGVRG